MGLGIGIGLNKPQILGRGIISPTQISNLTGWYDPNQEADGVLATFTDRSTAAQHATTITGSATIVAGASPNGLRKALRFAGAQNYVIPAGLIRPYSISLAYKGVTGNAGRTLGGGSTIFFIGTVGVSIGKVIFCNPGYVYDPVGALDIPNRLTLVAETTLSTAYDKKVNVQQTAVNLGNPGATTQIGSDNGVFFFTGDIYEICIYNKALSPGEIVDLDNYLSLKHGY